MYVSVHLLMWEPFFLLLYVLIIVIVLLSVNILSVVVNGNESKERGNYGTTVLHVMSLDIASYQNCQYGYCILLLPSRDLACLVFIS
jgi:hypothetical protein